MSRQRAVIRTPWSDDDVELLNNYQMDGSGHPYTCENRGNGSHAITNSETGMLVATRNGWICYDCDYRQDWAYLHTIDQQFEKEYPEPQPKNCLVCDATYTPGMEPDPCLGMLPGVRFACCGHGNETRRYVMTDTNEVLRQRRADAILGEPLYQRDPVPALAYTEKLVVVQWQFVFRDGVIWSHNPERDVIEALHTRAEANNWAEPEQITTKRLLAAGGHLIVVAMSLVPMSTAQSLQHRAEQLEEQEVMRRDGMSREADILDQCLEEGTKLFGRRRHVLTMECK